MIEGVDEEGRNVRIGRAWASVVVQAQDGSVRIYMAGCTTVVAPGRPASVMTRLKLQRETMH